MLAFPFGPRARPAPVLLLLLVLFGAAHAGAADVCSCGGGDALVWSSVSSVSGGAFSCTGGNGQLGPEDHVRIGSGCAVTITGDILQSASSTGGIEVEAGGSLLAGVGDGDRLRLSLGGAGLECAGDCTLAGAFRSLVGGPNTAGPDPWPLVGLEHCAGDCAATPELACATFPAPSWPPSMSRIQSATDLDAGTHDWLCLWDVSKVDTRVPYDDNSCYPVALVDASPTPRICVDLRQGADSEYPHRLRQIFQGTLGAAVAPGGGCATVHDPASGLVSGDCGGSVIRIASLGSGGAAAVTADFEWVGRFLRFAAPGGAPESRAYKILQSIDCASAPPSPHVCAGSSDDVLVVGDVRGVAIPRAAGESFWIDHGWRVGDNFFLLTPVQIDSATPGDDDTGVHFTGQLDVFGTHLTNLGGGPVGPENNTVVRIGGAKVDRWRHVLIRNDTGDFAPNTGKDLVLDGIVSATLGHTALMSNTGHAIVLGAKEGAVQGLVLEDFTIRHHQDGCFNHTSEIAQPGVTVRRSWCAFIQDDAASAQWFAWQTADPDATVIEDSACDACDGGHGGRTIRANSGFFDGWTVRRSLLWAPMGTLPTGKDNTIEDLTFLGFRGGDVASAPILGDRLERSTVRGVSVRQPRPLFQGELDIRDVLMRDIVTSRSGSGVVVADDDSRIEGSAFIDFDSVDASCQAGNVGCRVAQEIDKTTENVRWRRNLYAWSRPTAMGQGQRVRAVESLDPPEIEGLAIAFHDYVAGTGTALSGLNATTVSVPQWSSGPCFEGNDEDTPASALPGLPAETLFGGLGFVDPLMGRFDLDPVSAAAQLGCGPSPDRPPGARGYHYVHARSGIIPELLGADVDQDGWPETLGPPCVGNPDAGCSDNCPMDFNPSQLDSDLDGEGDACEGGLYGCGLGAEIAPLLVGLAALRRRTRRAA